MVGMGPVTDEMNRLVSRAIVTQARKDVGLPSGDRTMHLVFTGPPGTGKTTVADEVAKLYHALGLLPTDKIVHAKATDLIAGFLGQTEEKTQAAFDKARGGVLFIDEAYKIGRGEYGEQSLGVLVELMDRYRGNSVVILAGYPKEMDHLLRVNPGLESRMPNKIHFPRYTVAESQQIGDKLVADDKYKYAPGAQRAFHEAIAAHPRVVGNGREVRNLYESVESAQQLRLAAGHRGGRIPKETLEVLTKDDVRRGQAAYEAANPRRGKLASTQRREPVSV